MSRWQWYDPEQERTERIVKKWEKTGLLDDQLTLPFPAIILEAQSRQPLESNGSKKPL